jgi:hypothetical protein
MHNLFSNFNNALDKLAKQQLINYLNMLNGRNSLLLFIRLYNCIHIGLNIILVF